MAVAENAKAAIKDWVAVARTLATDFATRAAEHDASDSFVAENYQALRDAKIFSAPVPPELGGGGADFATHCEIIRAIGRGCGSTALSYSMHSHLLSRSTGVGARRPHHRPSRCSGGSRPRS
jgi:acyl-CoA dehydrogenase